MISDHQEPEVFTRSFADFDELTESARAWNLDLFKLETTPFEGRIFQFISRRLVLSRGVFGCPVRQVGSPPPSLRTIAVPMTADLRIVWRGQQVTGDDLMIFPLAGELEAVSGSGFDVCTISVVDDDLVAAAARRGRPELMASLRSREVFRGGRRTMATLRRVLQQAEARLASPSAYAGAMKDRILALVIRLIAEEQAMASPSRRAARQLRLVGEVNQVLRESPGRALSVAALADRLRVSPRSLQYAFREQLGVTPKAYLNALRLGAVRRLLRSAAPGTIRVADAANDLGFWHMGQFAADYRRLFGEHPSTTLMRGRR